MNTETFSLNTGATIPQVGLGCMRLTTESILHALKLGYRQLDTAYIYDRGENEIDVGKAIRESGIPREEIFVVTKLWNSHHKNVAGALDDSLKRLGLDYVDCYLMHWPFCEDPEKSEVAYEDWTYLDTYREMVKVYHETDKVKSIGVSNFTVDNLEAIKHTGVVPVINQIEYHPLVAKFENGLVDYCHKNKILIQAYCPLGGTGAFLVDNTDVVELAKKYKAQPGQILLSWCVQKGISVIPRSSKFERIEQNIVTIKLDDDDMKLMDGLEDKYGFHRINESLYKLAHP